MDNSDVQPSGSILARKATVPHGPQHRLVKSCLFLAGLELGWLAQPNGWPISHNLSSFRPSHCAGPPQSKFYKHARSRLGESPAWLVFMAAAAASGQRMRPPANGSSSRASAAAAQRMGAARAHPPASSRRFVRRPQHILSPFLSPPAMIFSTWLRSQPAYLAP